MLRSWRAPRSLSYLAGTQLPVVDDQSSTATVLVHCKKLAVQKVPDDLLCRSPRDQSYGLDGRSEVSRDFSTTHALSRTLSFLSCGVSENISPTAAHSHTSTFMTHASGHADELLSTRTGAEPAAHTSLPGLPRTRIAGLPLFLHADVAAVPKALPGVPAAAVLRGRLGAESIPDPLPTQVWHC